MFLLFIVFFAIGCVLGFFLTKLLIKQFCLSDAKWKYIVVCGWTGLLIWQCFRFISQSIENSDIIARTGFPDPVQYLMYLQEKQHLYAGCVSLIAIILMLVLSPKIAKKLNKESNLAIFLISIGVFIISYLVISVTFSDIVF